MPLPSSSGSFGLDMKITMPPPPSVNELFIRYLEFLKEIGVQDICLPGNYKKFLGNNDVSVDGAASESELSDSGCYDRSSSGFPDSRAAVRLFSWSGAAVSRLVCVCEKLPDEAEQRLSDRKLNDIIVKGLELKAEDVSICKVEYFTEGNRQAGGFGKELRRKIVSADPYVLLAMGDAASSFLLDRKVDVFHERGRWGEFEGVKVMPTLHPDYIVKNYTTRVRRDVFEDIKKVKGELDRL